MIRDNVQHALRGVRQEKTDRRIWIDTMCINQSDLDERNSQVAQMKSIFASAREVIRLQGETS